MYWWQAVDRISVDVGQFVLTGEPVAVMGNGAPDRVRGSSGRRTAGALCGVSAKMGSRLIPLLWWAINDNEKGSADDAQNVARFF